MTVRLSNPAQPEPAEEVKLLVDTGAILSVVPRLLLGRLGIKSVDKRSFRAFGGVIERETGGVLLRYDGASSVVPVVFGDAADPAVMGVTTLEALGYQVDPVSGELKPTEMLLLFL